MSKSPYTYTSLDTDLVTMAKDLENLGGGAARIEDSEVYVIIDDKIEIASRNDYSILKPLGTQIGYRIVHHCQQIRSIFLYRKQ